MLGGLPCVQSLHLPQQDDLFHPRRQPVDAFLRAPQRIASDRVSLRREHVSFMVDRLQIGDEFERDDLRPFRKIDEVIAGNGEDEDRKRVVWGKRVTGRVELGGGVNIKKKKKETK